MTNYTGIWLSKYKFIWIVLFNWKTNDSAVWTSVANIKFGGVIIVTSRQCAN